MARCWSTRPLPKRCGVLRDRPAQREVDRRFVYIDPQPDRGRRRSAATIRAPPGFFSVIFGSLSSIPREQPIRDNLERIDRQSREMPAAARIVDALRPDVEDAVEKLFGRTLFLDRPTAKRLAGWRAKARKAAAMQADSRAMAMPKSGSRAWLTIWRRSSVPPAPSFGPQRAEGIATFLSAHLAQNGLDGAPGASGFFPAQFRYAKVW